MAATYVTLKFRSRMHLRNLSDTAEWLSLLASAYTLRDVDIVPFKKMKVVLAVFTWNSSVESYFHFRCELHSNWMVTGDITSFRLDTALDQGSWSVTFVFV